MGIFPNLSETIMTASPSYTPKSPKYLSLQELLCTYPIYPFAASSRESGELLLEYKDIDDMISFSLHRKAHSPDITPQEHQEFLCTYILLILESESSTESI